MSSGDTTEFHPSTRASSISSTEENGRTGQPSAPTNDRMLPCPKCVCAVSQTFRIRPPLNRPGGFLLRALSFLPSKSCDGFRAYQAKRRHGLRRPASALSSEIRVAPKPSALVLLISPCLWAALHCQPSQEAPGNNVAGKLKFGDPSRNRTCIQSLGETRTIRCAMGSCYSSFNGVTTSNDSRI